MNARGRDGYGRFCEGNSWSSAGGLARAAALDSVRRREIARAGWCALVAKRFDGDYQRAAAWLGRMGAWASDAGYRAMGWGVMPDPGSCPGGRCR